MSQQNPLYFGSLHIRERSYPTRNIRSHIREIFDRLTDTGDNPKVLSDALEAVIDGGSRIVQTRILRLLYDRIGLQLPFAITTNFVKKKQNSQGKKGI